MRYIRKTVCCGALVAAAMLAVLANSAMAGIIYQAEFNTDGDFEGWVDFQNRLSSVAVSGGTVSGTAGVSGDPQLRTSAGTVGLDLGALPDATLEFRVKSSFGGTVLLAYSFREYVGAGAGNPLPNAVGTTNFTLAAVDTFETFTLDIKSALAGVNNAGTVLNDNILRALRIDPVNGSGAGSITDETFEVDFLRISTTIPEPASMGLIVMGLAVSTMTRRR